LSLRLFETAAFLRIKITYLALNINQLFKITRSTDELLRENTKFYIQNIVSYDILYTICAEGMINLMKCPYCGFAESKVIDSRPAEEGATIRRRRECLSCQKRFTTYEIMERLPLIVVKKDGSRQTFDKQKLINGMLRACEKRPVPLAEIQSVADDIEQELQNSLEREIKTTDIGEMIMNGLKALDEVAYVRFASVYRQFRDINTFMDELNKLLKEE